MALHTEYYDLIWEGRKTDEFGGDSWKARLVRWCVYLTAPVSRLRAVIDLAPAVAGAPVQAAIAEQAREGNGARDFSPALRSAR